MDQGGLRVSDSRVPASEGGIAEIDTKGKATFYSGVTQCDIVFVIDTTGSMSDKINGLIDTSQKFVDEIARRQIDWRIAIVGFGDLTVAGDKIVATGFSRNVEVIKRCLREVPRYSGGGNSGESSLEALVRALAIGGYRREAIKVFILMTDEPALQIQLTPDGVTAQLRQAGVLTFVISEPLAYFRDMATNTGGEWFQISSGTDFLPILDRLIKKLAQTVTDIQLTAGGDVQKYLQLRSGDRGK